MKTHAIGFLLSMCLMSCSAQENEKTPIVKSEKEIKANTNRPKVSWKVNKETDESGNIIRYDSTYTWSYTNVEGDSISLDVDSVMQSFNSYFNRHFPDLWESSFNRPFLKDSLFDQDFFHDDYYFKRWENDFFDMDHLFHEMDSIRNQFFNESYPGLIKTEKNKGSKSRS